jgi:hypothetical protein
VLLGVVSGQSEKVVEFFLEPEAAEAMIREVREDEPVLAEPAGRIGRARLGTVSDREKVFASTGI